MNNDTPSRSTGPRRGRVIRAGSEGHRARLQVFARRLVQGDRGGALGRYAPVELEAEEYDWIDTGEVWPDSGRGIKIKRPRGALTPRLDPLGNWAKMPRLMLAKVAEALAIRKAWPDDFANVYASEEVDRSRAAAVLPSEEASAGAIEERLARIGGGQPSSSTGWTISPCAASRWDNSRTG